jgi:hypothetical protein
MFLSPGFIWHITPKARKTYPDVLVPPLLLYHGSEEYRLATLDHLTACCVASEDSLNPSGCLIRILRWGRGGSLYVDILDMTVDTMTSYQ